MNEHPLIAKNARVVAEAERVYAEHGMAKALHAAVKAAYREAEQRPSVTFAIENAQVINILYCHALEPIAGEAA